jgi:hypothetical protein
VNVSYTAPLRDAWQRMRRLLFSPFQLEAWLVVGFSSFLAGLSGSPLAGGTGWTGGGRTPDAASANEALGRLSDVLANPLWLGLIALALSAFAILYGVLLWVCARAHFVFLENAVTGRAEFRAPWRRHAKLGQSLFLFWAALSFAWLVPIAFALVAIVPVVREWYLSNTLVPPPPATLWVCGAGLLASSFAILVAATLMHDFVVPLMWRNGEGAVAAWARFGPLLASRAGDFLAYLMFSALVTVVAVVAIVLAGIMTLCIGLLLLAIPYVGTVLLLPLLVTARGFGPAFLAQFGPEWNVFPAGSAGDSVGDSVVPSAARD